MVCFDQRGLLDSAPHGTVQAGLSSNPVLVAPGQEGVLFLLCVVHPVISDLATLGVAQAFAAQSQAALPALGIKGRGKLAPANLVLGDFGRDVAGDNCSKMGIEASLTMHRTLSWWGGWRNQGWGRPGWGPCQRRGSGRGCTGRAGACQCGWLKGCQGSGQWLAMPGSGHQ